MQKLIFILLIILILFLIFNYSKEHFQDSTTSAAPTTTAGPTTQAIINDDILMNIGLNNLNKHNLISCVHEDDDDDEGSPINVGNDENYSQCFNNDTKDKFIEIDKENKKCHIYTSLDCTNDEDKGKIIQETDFSEKVVFFKKSKELLFSLPDAPAAQVTILSNYIDIINGNNNNESVLSNRQNFRGDLSDINAALKSNINDSKHLNINDVFCCFAEHLLVTRLYTASTNGKFSKDSLTERLNAFNLNLLLKNTLEDIGSSNLQADYVDIYRKVIETDKSDSDIALAYNYQCLKVLLLMVISKIIVEDKFIEKYNSKYMTYLFYSFKRGTKIWSAYFRSAITRLRLDEAYIPFITTHFFNNQNNENIYKLFIYFIGTLTFDEIDFYNDSDYSKPLYKFEENKLEPMQNIENNRFIFFSHNELTDTSDYCKQANNDEEGCSKLQNLGCNYDSNTGNCHGKYEYKNCMQYNNAGKCNSVASCTFDETNNICKPKDCFTNSDGDPVCNTNYNHCDRFSEIQLNNRLQDICFDNVRMVKGGDENIEINNTFYQKDQGILDNCLDKIYEGNTIKTGNDLQKSCVQGCILGNFDNNSNVCVDNTHINKNNFFDARFCNNLSDQENCDIVQSCFWEGNRCYPNSSGDDKMQCTDFNSEERCPNSCVWYDGRCNNIYNENNNNSTAANSLSLNSNNNSTATEPSTFEIKSANCSSINHTNHSDTDKKNECIFNNCDWLEEKKLCVDTINNGCLFKSDSDCVDREKNFDNLYFRNKCKLITDQEDNSKTCVDNNFKIPCKFYGVGDCPTDKNPKVNFYGEQSETPYCMVNIDGDKCIEKDNHVSDSCNYNYLKDGGESHDNYSKNCKEVELSVKEGNQTRMVSGSFSRENLPCSLLEKDNCTFGTNERRCIVSDDSCKSNDRAKTMFEKISEVSDVSQYDDYTEIISKVSNIYKTQNQKNMCRHDSQIIGVVSKYSNNEIHTNSNLDKLTNINNIIVFFVNVELIDLIRVYGESQINKLTDYEKERLVDSLNLQARRNIKLLDPMSGSQNHSWKSKKHQITGVNFSKLVRGGKKITIRDSFYNNISNDEIISPFDILSNIRLVSNGNINTVSNPITVPINTFIKWYIPNPQSNLDECLDNITLKNLDNDRFFSI
jgi:hypothetical protein